MKSEAVIPEQEAADDRSIALLLLLPELRPAPHIWSVGHRRSRPVEATQTQISTSLRFLSISELQKIPMDERRSYNIAPYKDSVKPSGVDEQTSSSQGVSNYGCEVAMDPVSALMHLAISMFLLVATGSAAPPPRSTCQNAYQSPSAPAHGPPLAERGRERGCG
ncbi:unnamed protein product [Pleuronectes platessa]|uniref:Uncharacterized protein n=1 Tax=Pleuronectes platessa TaxID=8262 RepID=A0A9N7Y115_PLEPL|nr:unnamed protein product [Pleuronectes platessa]